MEVSTFGDFIALVTAILLAIIAWYNKKRTETSEVTAEAATATARTNAVMAVQTNIVRKMDAGTKEWCTFDATPENKKTILEQIAAAELANLYTYQVHFNGGYYIIENGLLKGGAGNPSGIKTN